MRWPLLATACVLAAIPALTAGLQQVQERAPKRKALLEKNSHVATKRKALEKKGQRNKEKPAHHTEKQAHHKEKKAHHKEKKAHHKASHEKEQRAKETIHNLKLETNNLSHLVEQGAGLSVNQENTVNNLNTQRDELLRTRDSLESKARPTAAAQRTAAEFEEAVREADKMLQVMQIAQGADLTEVGSGDVRGVAEASVAAKEAKEASEKTAETAKASDQAEAGEASEKADPSESIDKAGTKESSEAAEIAEASDKAETGEASDKVDGAESTDKAGTEESSEAAEAAEASDKAEAGEASEKADGAESTDKAGTEESSETAEAAEAFDKAEAGEASEKTDGVESTDKAGTEESSEAAETAEASDKAETGEASDKADASESTDEAGTEESSEAAEIAEASDEASDKADGAETTDEVAISGKTDEELSDKAVLLFEKGAKAFKGVDAEGDHDKKVGEEEDKGHGAAIKAHKADYNYQPQDFQLAGSKSGYANFIKKYPCTRSSGPDGFPNKFDWVIHRQKDIDDLDGDKDPHAVFSTMEIHTVPAILDFIEQNWPDSKKKRVAYFTGDMMLSRVDKNFGAGTEERLRKAFSAGIWWQAYDVQKPGFKVAPDGLNGMYLMPVWDVAQKAIDAATLEGKTKGVLAAWGKFHPNLDANIPARRKLHEWVGTKGSIAAGVEHASFEPREYWPELAKYRFTLSPRGGGIQSPKNDEALLVLTIPISTREGSRRGFKSEPAFDDLKKLGWPMVVLDEWSEITQPKLDQWWEELSPRLLSFRKNCLTTEGFWRIITGEVTYCE